MPKYDVDVQLTGIDGNVFSIISAVSTALTSSIDRTAASAFEHDAFNCASYDEVLMLAMKTVNVV